MPMWTLTLAFCRTFPLLGAMMDRGLFFIAVAEFTGESPLLVVVGVFGAGLVEGAILGYRKNNTSRLVWFKYSAIKKNKSTQ